MPSTLSQTIDGHLIDLLDPDPDLINAPAIAHALSQIVRFAGNNPAGPYSVAQHSYLGALQLEHETGDKKLALHFLLHDAHEAFIGDIPSPVVNAMTKAMLNEISHTFGIAESSLFYEKLEELASDTFDDFRTVIDKAIYKAFGLKRPDHKQDTLIRQMDLRMLRWEYETMLIPCKNGTWDKAVMDAKPIKWPDHISLTISPYSRARWLACFEDYTKNQ